jgi:hypothetical protein
MIPPAAAPDFLASHGWAGAQIRPLAGDASFRRYFRVHRGEETAVLMDAPPDKEDIGPFLTVAGHLIDRGFAPPRPLAVDRRGAAAARGFRRRPRRGRCSSAEPGVSGIYEAPSNSARWPPSRAAGHSAYDEARR